MAKYIITEYDEDDDEWEPVLEESDSDEVIDRVLANLDSQPDEAQDSVAKCPDNNCGDCDEK